MTVNFFDGADGVTLSAEAAFVAPGSRYAIWGVSLWGRGTWGPGTTYVDLSSRIRGFGTTRRFDRTLERWQGGSGWCLLDNRDGDLSPSNLAGTYVVGGMSTILPGRAFRISAHYSGTTYRLLTGVIDDWKEEIISCGPYKGDAAIRVEIVDAWAELADIDGVEVAPVGASDTFGARISRILSAASWRGGSSLDVGQATMQDTTLSRGPTSEMETTAKAEGGLVWADAEGRIRAAGRTYLVESERSRTVQATFGDLDAAHLPYTNPRPSFDRRLIINVASYTRTGGTTQTASDDASRARYKLRRKTETGLICQTDAQALELARWQVARYREPRRRIEQITAYPRARAALWPVLLGLQELDLVRVVHHPPGGYTDDVYCHVSGIAHTVQPGGNWQTDTSLWSASPYYEYVLSRWGVAQWGRARWFM